MSIYPSGGVLDGNGGSQPNIEPSANCVRFYGCDTPIDVNALNDQLMELQNVWDLEGIPYDCSSQENLFNAIQAIACRKACEEITARRFVQVINGNDGVGSITLPAGSSWDVDGYLWAGGDTNTLINSGGFVGGEIDDDDDTYFAFIGGNYPGGTTFSVADINPDVTDNVEGYSFKISATRVGDC